jgi:hypothetical protein
MQRMLFHDTYDINDAVFVEFFKLHSGYDLTSCSANWKQEGANPAFPLNQLQAFYLKDGQPVPDEVMESIREVWRKTRRKLQISWELYEGRSGFQATYKKLMEV